jgi:lipid II:glycine glycyltransferase (peptidoglycan interpeptide bridge formation enzyme)
VLVDLARPLEAIWAGFHSNTRNRVRVAEKRGVAVRVARAEEMESFVSLFEETGARHGLTKNDAAAARLSPKHFGGDDRMRLFLASHDGVDIAGIVVFLGSGWATYLWGGSSAAEEARRVNPNQLLHWTAMQWAHSRGCTTYDLFGVPDYDVEVLEANYPTQTEGWWNLYKFKRGFGGTVHRHAGTFDCVLAKRPGPTA